MAHSMSDDDPLGGGGASRSRPGTPRASLSARYLSQPQRLVGCSLPPLTRDASTTTRARGFVTLAVPHILESAATTQSLPDTTLVRFRWRDEESARGSLFQPAKIANAPGLVLQRRTRRDLVDGNGGAGSRDDLEDEEEVTQESPSHASARSVEMVYPICADVQRFVEYLRDMRELVLDVIDRSTRRTYGKCVIPLFNDTSAASSGNSRPPQAATTAALERVLHQLRRENALYEIKSLDSDQDNDMIGYLAVKLDVQSRDLDDAGFGESVPASLQASSLNTLPPPAPVLIPRTRPAVHVNVRQHFERRRGESDELHREAHFGALSPISYLESDAFHSIQGNSPRSESVLSSMSSLPHRGEERTHRATGSPIHSSKLHHLIEKGKALQKSMAKAAEDGDEDWYGPQFPVTSTSSRENGTQEIVNAVLHEDLSDSVSDDDPRSWQSILKQAQKPSQETEQRSAHHYPVGSGKAPHSHSVKGSRGLKMTFEALKFTSEFIEQLQQMRDSAISSRFSPIEMAVSHSDVATLLATMTKSSMNQVESPESLFTITPSLRKRAFRLTYSHVVPLQSHRDSSSLGLASRSSKKQLQFFVTCKTQGTPRRLQQSSRNGKKHQIVLRGGVPVHDILFEQSPTSEPRVVNVSLFIHGESGSAASTTRRQETAHRVGVLKVEFHFCNVEAESRESEIKGESHLIFSSPPSSRESVAQSAGAPKSLLETREKQPRDRSYLTRDVTRKRPAPTLKIATQVAVMLDKVSSVCSSEGRLGQVTLEHCFIRFQYAMPQSSSVRESSQPIGSAKRSFRRKLLRVAGSQKRSSKYHANVGHIGVFPLELDQLLTRDFKKRLLIVEAWLQGVQHAKDDEGELLGLVKIPFSTFSSCFRENSRDWDQAIPFVGVDGRLPIEDPFSGNVSGFLQIRIAVGTAEQIIALASTVRAIVQLQALVRGVLCRKVDRALRATKRHAAVGEDSAHTLTAIASPGKEGNDNFRDRAIPATKTEVSPRKESWGQHPSPDNGEAERSVEQAKDDVPVNVCIPSRDDYVHEIRLEIRECWRSAQRGDAEKRGAWNEPSAAIGCEVQGEMLLTHGQMATPTEEKAVQFALWWDASHSQLNSHFEHSFRSKDGQGEDGLMAHVSEVKFTFQVQTDFVQSSSSTARQGQAVLNVQQIFGDAIKPERLRREHISVDKNIDVPIEWEDGPSSRFCCAFPVRVCYRVSSRALASRDQFQAILPARLPHMLDRSSLMTTTSISTTRRLLPATINLSIRVLSVTDLKHAIEEKWSQVCVSPSEKELKKHLEGLLTDGAASVIFECDACLGVEVEESAEGRSVERNGASSHLYKKNERWYRKLRFPTARCDVANSQQLLSSTLPPFQLKIIVHPEAMQVMQNECLEIHILSWCSRSNSEYQIGTVSAPIAPVLFRRSGVQGTFPISIGDALSGRLGVHVHIAHQPDAAISHRDTPDVVVEERERRTELTGSIVPRPVSPRSPEEAMTDQYSSSPGEGNQLIQVTVEDFRNLQFKDDGDDERGFLFSIETEFFDGEERLRGDVFSRVDFVGRFYQIGETETRSVASNRVGVKPSVRIGVWHGDDTKTEEHLDADRLAQGAILIGWCLVDLSLLEAGWREVHGWYHIFDGQQISRGQVKMKASLGSGGWTIEEKQGSFSVTQLKSDRATAEGVIDESDSDGASESATYHSPVQPDTARRASFFDIEEDRDVLSDSWTSTTQLDEKTRSVDSDMAVQDSDRLVDNSFDFSLATATNVLEAPQTSDADGTPTIHSQRDTFEDEEGLRSSVPNGGVVDVSVETNEVATDEKSTQVNMESCMSEEEDSLGELNGAEGDGDDAIQANSEVSGNGEREDSVRKDVPQPELLNDRTTKSEMVDVGCGTSDDFDHVTEEDSPPRSSRVVIGARTHREDLEANGETAVSTFPQATEALEADGKPAGASSDDGRLSVAPKQLLLRRPQDEPPTKSSLNAPADAFELICQLLTEIRDSCGTGLVREILQAHNAQVALSESRAGLISTDGRSSMRQEENATMRVERNEAERNAEQNSMGESDLAKSHEEGLASSYQKLRQSRGSVFTGSAEDTGADACGCTDRQSYSSGVSRENPRLSARHFSRRDLNAAFWSDSSTLQQEMQRRLAASDAGQDLCTAVAFRVAEMGGESRASSRRDSKLFGDDIEAHSPALFAFQTRRTKKPFAYKADSETERIARIMQGSVNYWRKGDEHALTSDDDSVDSFDSDDDCYF